MGVDNISSSRPLSISVERIKDRIISSELDNQSTNNLRQESMEDKENSSELSKDKLEKMVEGLNEFLKPAQTSLKFQFHDKLNEYYVEIIDSKTKQVVKEIPPKKLLDMYASMMERLGIFVDQKI